MPDTATCAACGNIRDLCNSVRIKGVKQPRICKDCFTKQLSTGELEINDLYWVAQLNQLNDRESLALLGKKDDDVQLAVEPGDQAS